MAFKESGLVRTLPNRLDCLRPKLQRSVSDKGQWMSGEDIKPGQAHGHIYLIYLPLST